MSSAQAARPGVSGSLRFGNTRPKLFAARGHLARIAPNICVVAVKYFHFSPATVRCLRFQ
ncbi:hypothetical protein SAMN05216228_102717 [Rhizobium tibeticum]|uniref:Uncharacterized protein n=1 Tax=Rhizobium tibeticum TaxID=501024 RepID=A0A1H8T2X3_9HYPH|nr:hypothetical protein RTCCBAU85039_5090 [Rhizobium tibeticum]SEO85066.1 hypothetical protein SAMN05216228_102717 [Rhizobium tibeticum]